MPDYRWGNISGERCRSCTIGLATFGQPGRGPGDCVRIPPHIVTRATRAASVEQSTVGFNAVLYDWRTFSVNAEGRPLGRWSKTACLFGRTDARAEMMARGDADKPRNLARSTNRSTTGCRSHVTYLHRPRTAVSAQESRRIGSDPWHATAASCSTEEAHICGRERVGQW